jgi:fatty-acyl-CoA synthase
VGRSLVELPLTPLELLTRARRLFADRVGVIEADQRWTYGEFAGRCDRLGHALQRDLDVGHGQVVGWLGGNTHELLEAYFGVLLAGGVLLPLNIRLAPAELRAILEASGAVVLFRHPDQPDPGHRVPTIVLGDEHEVLLAAQPDDPVDTPPIDEHAPAELFYTSGSTGTPKGALLSHRGLYLHAIHSALTMGLTGEDVFLHTIPLFHVNGWGTPHFVTGLGGVQVMLPRFDAGEVLRLVEAHGVTRLFLVPAMARLLLDHPDAGSHDLSSVRQVSVGGASASPALLAELEARIGCEVICGYGMTESSPTLTRSLSKPGTPSTPAQRATTGIPILGADVRVLDASDVEVPWDGQTIGEICARSNHVMIGYLDAPEATAEVLRAGWLRTGDLAVVDPDGYLTIVDRAKDLIVSGGENIASVEVEQALELHPAVREAAVVGVPDDRWGEVPRAFVSLAVGASVTESELIGWTRERLAAFKTPKSVVVLDELPKVGTGKIDKQSLRARGQPYR